MPRPTSDRIWSKGSATSQSSTSTRSDQSSRSSLSSHTQYTTLTSCSDTKPVVKHYHSYEEREIFDGPSACIDDHEDDPRASIDTYASTTASETDSSRPPSLCPLMRHICYKPDAIATTPVEFGELFPSTRRILIQHDDTTPDGNLNLRIDTELTISKGHKLKLTLFHLRMYDLAERQFSLRRYQRQSGREVCNSKRKYLKPVAERPSSSTSSPRRRSFTSTLAKLNLRTLKSKPRPKPAQEIRGEESDEDFSSFAEQVDVKATIPTDTIKIEFSNYAQVELERSKTGDSKYEFEYWGERYSWRRNIYRDESELVFSFELITLSSGVCIAHITPDKLSRRQSRQEAALGGWIPPCSLRLTEKDISNDLGDVIMATGLMTLVDDCIKRHWDEPHRS
ncbi:uncharacterized protein Z520_03542 [Fonsecaea multimorphosa CBS 102226]|uniref:Uncharacterized protein n=1 Tax=Fonsecaea multimorphosa CBS 102226 TaxID=1442371 RepID=A0A0D2HG77_9EURO|nr:uncharacterized protein Z520_03542 [Fonsecaea multimorphosa CBS 102226]KIY00876.1 hypothetical protein Z520_03542 [Fonsecaea multimorphosa CBS 102226]OAL27702.1 hypothetical protein AYO22_03368 [Fonsecaea multimorphosa]